MSDFKFPKGVIKVTGRPTLRNHAGRTWDSCDVILPNGREILGHQETTWSSYFYFEFERRWYRAPWAQFEVPRTRALIYDLRDQAALKAFAGMLDEFETAVFASNSELIAALSGLLDDAATACGYNNHQHLRYLHTLAEARV